MSKNKVFLLSLISAITIYAAVPAPGSPAPAPDYTSNIPSDAELNATDPNSNFVGNDTLPQAKVNTGLHFEVDVGTSTLTPVKQDDGSIKYLNNSTGEINQTIIPAQTSSTYQDKLKAYYAAPDDNNTAQLDDLKAQSQKENKNKNFSLKQNEDLFLKNLNPSGSGMGIVNRFLTQKPGMTEAEQNATKFYKSNFGYMNSQNNSKQVDKSNVANIKNAYNFVKDFQTSLAAKNSSKSVQCYISRELIPSFYCSYADMTNTLYPVILNGVDQLKTASQVALSTCNAACVKPNACINYNVLNSTDVNTTLSANLFPNYSEITSVLDMNVSSKALLTNLNLNIKLVPKDMNASDFETFLQSNPVNFRITILKKDLANLMPPAVLVDTQVVNLNSSTMIKSFNLSTAADRLVIKIYKPYSYDSIEDKNKEAIIFSHISNISIENVNANYASTDLYFCPFKQLVERTSDCTNGKIQDLTIGAQIYHICMNDSHKIGPESSLGGFFTEDTCNASCLESKPCLPTYKQYSDPTSSVVYKANVGCVDDGSGTNTGCTTDKCKAFFANDDTRPLNESVIYNDDTRVYTVKDKVLTGKPRPRIDIGAEMATTDTTQDYQSMFQNEMKDTAYAYMIKNNTFNRIHYLIGEASPIQQAYKKDYINGKTQFSVLLKPNSFDVDSNDIQNLYSVIVLEQAYRPISGMYMIDGQNIDASKQSVMFKDLNYFIKTSTDWKLFKKQEFYEVRKEDVKYYCTTTAATDPNAKDAVWTQIPSSVYDPSNPDCKKDITITWPNISSSTSYIDRNVMYDSNTQTFATFDPSMTADSYLQTTFTSKVDYNTYRLTDWLEQTLEDTPGGMIHSQLENENGLSFSKIYDGNFTSARGYPTNYWVYNYYSKTPLTYQNLIDKINNNEGIFFALDHTEKYQTKIYHDGELNNDIHPFIFGTPNNTTVSVETWPTFSEEHQKVFKFMFLYDDTKISPLNGYIVK